MQYEIRVWKDQAKMPKDVKASSAKNKIAAEGESSNAALKGAKRGNPDIKESGGVKKIQQRNTGRKIKNA